MASQDTSVSTQPSSFDATFLEMRAAAVQGAKAAAASVIAEKCADFVIDRFKGTSWFPSFLSTSMGRKGLTLALPPVIYYLTLAIPERIPNVEGVRAAAKYAMLGHSVMFVAPILNNLGDLFSDLAKFAKEEGLDAAPASRPAASE